MSGIPIGTIASALRSATDGGKPALVAGFARQWQIAGRPARRAAEGKDVDASTYLKLCAALGLDPMTGNRVEPSIIPDVDWNRVGIKIQLEFIGTPERPAPKDFTMRKASKQWGVALAPLARMKGGSPASAANLLTLCAALGFHPHQMLKAVPADVSQNHVAEQQQVTR